MGRTRLLARLALTLLGAGCSRSLLHTEPLAGAVRLPNVVVRGGVVGCEAAAPDAPCFQRQPANLIIAVMPFDVAKRDTLLVPLSFGMADLLSTDLSRSRRLTLVERLQLGAILRELAFAESGRVDTATAPRVGRLLQAGRVVLGNLRLTPGGDLVFGVRVSTVTTGRVDTALVATARLTNVLAAEKAVALRLFTHLGVNLTPQERALVEQIPTRNLAALLAYGQGVQDEINGQYAAARGAFRRAARLDPNFAAARERSTYVRPIAIVDATTLAVNGVNRPLVGVPTSPQPHLVTDPGFPGALATVIIVIVRP